MLIIASTIAICFYLLCAGYQARFLFSRRAHQTNPKLLLLLGGIAVCAHAVSALSSIHNGEAIDLGFFRVSSLISWFIATISLISTLRRPTASLLVLVFPLAAVSIIVSSMVAPVHELKHSINKGMLAHILLSILTYSVLTIATIQAIALAVQEYQLKHRHTRGIIEALPPLQTMEQMLFELIWIGIVLLSLSIVTGIIYIDNIYAQHLVHKTVLSIIAWVIFAILLWGRHQRGWRSQTAVRWTIGGFIALMLGYFGSKLVLEIILNVQ